MKPAFTMVELIFVIILLGLISGIMIPKMNASRNDAIVAGSVENIRTLVADLESFYLSHGYLLQDPGMMSSVVLEIAEIDPTKSPRASALSLSSDEEEEDKLSAEIKIPYADDDTQIRRSTYTPKGMPTGVRSSIIPPMVRSVTDIDADLYPDITGMHMRPPVGFHPSMLRRPMDLARYLDGFYIHNHKEPLSSEPGDIIMIKASDLKLADYKSDRCNRLQNAYKTNSNYYRQLCNPLAGVPYVYVPRGVHQEELYAQIDDSFKEAALCIFDLHDIVPCPKGELKDTEDPTEFLQERYTRTASADFINELITRAKPGEKLFDVYANNQTEFDQLFHNKSRAMGAFANRKDAFDRTTNMLNAAENLDLTITRGRANLHRKNDFVFKVGGDDCLLVRVNAPAAVVNIKQSEHANKLCHRALQVNGIPEILSASHNCHQLSAQLRELVGCDNEEDSVISNIDTENGVVYNYAASNVNF